MAAQDRASILRAELLRRELARRQSAAQTSSQTLDQYPAQAPTSDPTLGEAIVRGGAQGLTLGWEPQLAGAAAAMTPARGTLAPMLSNPSLSPGLSFGMALANKPNEQIVADYRATRDSEVRANEAAQKAHPVVYGGAELVTGAATTALTGGAGGAAKGAQTASRLAKAAKAAKTGAGVGAMAGLGSSKADLTKGEFGAAAADTLVGAGFGAGIGAASEPVANAVGGVLKYGANKLRELGQARLFKAAVGQTKRAFTQMNGKGLLDKAGQYLDDMKIGIGDSTESIGRKLAARRDSIRDTLTKTVEALDQFSGGSISVSPSAVADAIEKKVAAPLKKLAAARGEYADVMVEVKAIREVGQPLNFSEAVAQRQAAQQQINYDVVNKRDIMADARREIARIWNDEIDKQAEPLLKKAGKAGDAYRELRHEFSLVDELYGHVQNRMNGNKAIRVLSPTDHGMGWTAALMTGNPVLGLTAAIANHLGRVYGNASAGRVAIGIAKAASRSEAVAERYLPQTLRSPRVMPPTLELAPAMAADEPIDDDTQTRRLARR